MFAQLIVSTTLDRPLSAQLRRAAKMLIVIIALYKTTEHAGCRITFFPCPVLYDEKLFSFQNRSKSLYN